MPRARARRTLSTQRAQPISIRRKRINGSNRHNGQGAAPISIRPKRANSANGHSSKPSPQGSAPISIRPKRANSTDGHSSKPSSQGATPISIQRKRTNGTNGRSGQHNGLNNEISEDLSQVVQSYMPLVRHAVNRIAVGSSSAGILQYEDMVSCGVQGLIEAYHSFDPNRGAKFSTYALPRIRGAILDALRAAHPLPRSLQKFSSDMDQASAALHVELGRSPTTAELAKQMGLQHREFLATLRTSSIRVISLDGLADNALNGNTEKLWELADGDPGVDPDSMAQDTMVRRILNEAVADLPERERTIVHLYYMKSHSLKSIGKALGISESRASQLRHRAIRRLRTALTEELKDAA